MAKEKICCIYKIINIKNNKYYLGSTVNFSYRISNHKTTLKSNKHHNIKLQNAYNKDGKDSFKFEIIQRCTPEKRLEIEQSYLDKLDYKFVYNVASTASGGDLIKNHPNRENIIKKSTEELYKARNAPGYREHRSEITRGNRNPNFGNKWDDNQKRKASRMMKKRMKNLPPEEKERLRKLTSITQRAFWDGERGLKKRKELSEAMKGEYNHFYGKKHSKKTIQKLRKMNLGKRNQNDWKPITIEGVNYNCLTDASKILKIPIATVYYRLNSTNPKFINWNYFGKAKDCKPLQSSNAVKYKVKDKIYSSISAASEDLNLSLSALIFRAKSNNPKWNDFSLIGEKKNENPD